MNIFSKILQKTILLSALISVLEAYSSNRTSDHNDANWNQEQMAQKVKTPKWQLGAGFFYGSTPHYPASNHLYVLASPAPLFIYRFQSATFKRRELSKPLSATTRLAFTLGFSAPVGKNTRRAEQFSTDAANPNKRIVTEDNFHRRGMEAIPAIFKLGGQIAYQPNPHVDLKLPLFVNLGLNNTAYQGYETHPEIEFSLKPNADNSPQAGFNIVGSIEVKYGDLSINQLYYQVKPDEVIDGRNAYDAKAGEYARSYRIALQYQQQFNYHHSIRFFLSYRHQNYAHSANTQSPLHIVNENNIIATGFAYYFYSSKETVTR